MTRASRADQRLQSLHGPFEVLEIIPTISKALPAQAFGDTALRSPPGPFTAFSATFEMTVMLSRSAQRDTRVPWFRIAASGMRSARLLIGRHWKGGRNKSAAHMSTTAARPKRKSFARLLAIKIPPDAILFYRERAGAVEQVCSYRLTETEYVICIKRCSRCSLVAEA